MARTTQEEASNKAMNRSRASWAISQWKISSRDSVIADVTIPAGQRHQRSSAAHRASPGVSGPQMAARLGTNQDGGSDETRFGRSIDDVQ